MVQSFDESERAAEQQHTGLEYLTEPDPSAELEDLALNPAFDSPSVEPVSTSTTAEDPESPGEITGLEGITEINLDNLDPAADPSAGNTIPAEPSATSPSAIGAVPPGEAASAEVSPDAASPSVVPLGSNFSESIAPAPEPLPIDSEKEVNTSQPPSTVSPDAASTAQPTGLQPEAQPLPTPEPTIQPADTATPAAAAIPVKPTQEQAAIPVEPIQEQEQADPPSDPSPEPEVTPVEPPQAQSGANTAIQSGQPTRLQPELQPELQPDSQASVPTPASETSPETLEAAAPAPPAPSDRPPAQIIPIVPERVENQAPDLPPDSANGTGVVWSNENPNFHRMEVEGQPSGSLNGQIGSGPGPAPLPLPAPPPTVQTMQAKQPPLVIPGRQAAAVLPDSEQRDPRYEAASARQSQQIFITFVVLAVGLLLGFLANPFQNRNNRSIPPETVNQGP